MKSKMLIKITYNIKLIWITTELNIKKKGGNTILAYCKISIKQLIQHILELKEKTEKLNDINKELNQHI